MQTFLPYPSFTKSAEVLDNKRLGKQRVEAYQILRTNLGLSNGWKNHPACKMWKGHEYALAIYGLAVCREWIERGFKDTVYNKINDLVLFIPAPKDRRSYCAGYKPSWLGNMEFHLSHRSNLSRKNPDYYSHLWPDIPDDLPYFWPVR